MTKEGPDSSRKGSVRAAIIEPIGGHGGMDYYDFGLCRGLLDAGCGVSLYTSDETRDPAIPELGFYPVYRRIFSGANRWIRAIWYVRGSIAALGRSVFHGEKICHLHVFQGAIEELVQISLAKLSGRRLVITVHDVESFCPGAMSQTKIQRAYQLADRFIVHNQVSKRELVEKMGMPATKVDVVESGHYLDDAAEHIESAEAKRRLGIRESSKVVLFFGHIREVKGLDILIEAIAEASREVPEITLLVGGKPLRTEFTEYDGLIDRLGMRGRCVLHIRFIQNSELPFFFAASDLVALPYRRIYQSAVVLMAMSHGKAVVVSDLPGMTEMVTDGKNGYVFESGSKNALAVQLIRALNDDVGRAEIAEKALASNRENNDWGRIGKKTLAVYASVLSD